MASNVIYCFSGTGNCLDLAKTIASALGDTEIRSMRSEPRDFDAREADRVGFIFPCYAGGLPEHVEEYAGRVEITPGTYTFAVVSYAAYPGCGLHVIDSLHKLDYWAGVAQPCSCIWLFPHDVTGPAEKVLAKSGKKVQAIAGDILEKKTRKSPPKAAVNQLEHAAWPAMSRKKAAALDADTRCIGCGQCVKLCPRGNIHMQGVHPQFGLDCVGCLGCLQYCPVGAISMGGVTVKRKRYHNPNVTAAELMKDVVSVE